MSNKLMIIGLDEDSASGGPGSSGSPPYHVFNEEDSIKLLSLFNDELNDIPKSDIVVERHKDGKEVKLISRSGKEFKLKEEVLRLTERLERLQHAVLHYSSVDTKEELIRKAGKQVNIAVVPSKNQTVIRLYSKDEGTCQRVKKKLEGVAPDPIPAATSSRKNRWFVDNNTDFSQSGVYDTIDSESSDSDSGSSIYTGTWRPDIKLKFKEAGLTVKVYKASITKLRVDAIVNAANEHLSNGAGVAGAISDAAGWEFNRECKNLIRERGTIPVTQNYVTNAYKLPCKKVIHAVGPQWHYYQEKEECLKDLCKTIVEVLHTSIKERCSIVVMPPISSGLFGVPKPLCAAMYIRGINKFCKSCHDLRKLREFHIIDISDEMLDLIKDSYQNYQKDPKSLNPSILLEWDHGSSSGYQRSGGNHSRNSGQRRVSSHQGSSSGNWDGSDHYSGNSGQRRGSDQQGGTANHSSKPDHQGAVGHHGSNTNYRRGGGDHGIRSADECRIIDLQVDRMIYLFRDKLQVHIYVGDITKLEVDVIVSTENRRHDGSGSLSKAIRDKAGWLYRNVYLTETFPPHNLPAGKILVSKPGSLKCKAVFHLILEQLPPMKPLTRPLLDGVFSGVKTLLCRTNLHIDKEEHIFKKDEKHRMRRIAMPLLGAGALKKRENIASCCREVYKALSWFAGHKQGADWLNLKQVHLVDMRKEVIDIFNETFGNEMSVRPARPLPPTPKPDNFVKSTGQTGWKQNYEFTGAGYNRIDEWKISKRRRSFNESNFEEFMEPFRKQHNPKPHRENKPHEPKGNLMILGTSTYKGAGKTPEDFNPLAKPTDEQEEHDSCIVCMDTMDDPMKLRKCGHVFCKECIMETFKQRPFCPVCSMAYGALHGDQPTDGKATIYVDKKSLPQCDVPTLIIDYNFPDGIQGEEHTNPGLRYKGLRRQCYLPDNRHGRRVLGMLKKAFEQRLIFTIGQSRTSGEENVLTWNDIHHKTRRDGGPEKYGYPDPDYLERVEEELNAKGIDG